MMGDCERRRHPYAIHLLSRYQIARDAPLQPANLGELLVVRLHVAAFGLRETSNHQRGGKWPGLGRIVSYLAYFHGGLLHQLPPHRFLDRFARLHETCQRGEHWARKPLVASHETRVAMGRQHDDDRIDARKMLGVAFAAQPPVASIHNPGRRAAVRAEAVPLMPVDQRLRLRDNRGVLARYYLRCRARITKIAESGERSP